MGGYPTIFSSREFSSIHEQLPQRGGKYGWRCLVSGPRDRLANCSLAAKCGRVWSLKAHLRRGPRSCFLGLTKARLRAAFLEFVSPHRTCCRADITAMGSLSVHEVRESALHLLSRVA